ncbi:DUF6529 family protein [Kribbella sp. VKM Ac-2568]|uniref:DUF6529 family protein n=1 Tax=Kribbella sp. VKM Ac-2568 TaxID=2512219 RepID=UPI00104D7DEA|nr:DUF6529 family protein [Kribbella sp. VKM Ac-2568]TCM48812.1 hypothetical protein EV648_10376 [Kribbella sp. VKM Ac-2568]
MNADVDATGGLATEPPGQGSTGQDPAGTAGKGPARKGIALLLVFAVVGALVSLSLGYYGRTHTPTGRPLALLVGFTGLTPMKAWLGTAAVALGIFQVVSAMWMYGRLPVKRKAPPALSQAHRWSGAVAFVATLPVAYHCLWSLGFSTFDTRTTLHSLFGCAFYGAFTTKMLALRANRMPGWALPIAGGLLFALLVGAWATAALWYFAQPGVPLR